MPLTHGGHTSVLPLVPVRASEAPEAETGRCALCPLSPAALLARAPEHVAGVTALLAGAHECIADASRSNVRSMATTGAVVM